MIWYDLPNSFCFAQQTEWKGWTVLTLYPSTDDSLASGSTCFQAIFIDLPFNFLLIICGGRLGAGNKRKTMNQWITDNIKMTQMMRHCWPLLNCRKAQHTGFLGVNLEVLAGWPVSGRVVASNFNKVVWVRLQALQFSVVFFSRHHNPLWLQLTVFVTSPVIYLRHRDTGEMTKIHLGFGLKRNNLTSWKYAYSLSGTK